MQKQIPSLGALIVVMLAGAPGTAGAQQPGPSAQVQSPAPMSHAGHMITSANASMAAFTLPENIPDFSQDTTRPGVESVQTGPWSSPSTWQGGQVPTANHIVRVMSGHRVTIDGTAALAYTVVVDGTLAFSPAVNTRLNVTNLEVMAGNMGMGTPGVLELGTVATPIAAGVSAEIVISNTAIGGSVTDTDQFGTGIIVLGKVSMHGSVKTPTFVRVATEPRAGHTTLTLSLAVTGWSVGDRIVLPDTRHIKESEVTGSGWVNTVNQWEERTVQAVSGDGKTITLNAALTYDHLGARDQNGVLEFLPHVGNLTRNVIIRSESATGTRGHMLNIHTADVDIRYALFRDMGRTTYLPLNTTTNKIGRYPIHVHHLSGPATTPANGYQFTLVGNAVDGGSVETKFKWGITVHGSHYGLLQDNVVYNYNGSAIATEDGSESFNVFDHNFALRGMGEPNDSVSEARMAMGTEGVGFWFRGPNNYVRNNVAANYQNSTTEAAYGFVYQFRYLGNVAIPNFKGADTMVAAQATTRDGNNMPILQFENNEAYGAMQGGFTLWWVSSQDPQPGTGAQDSVLKDLKIWNTYNKAVYMYPSQKVIFDGLKIRGNFTAASRCCGNGVYFADYSSKGIVIRNSDIQGMEEGITAPEAGFGPEANLLIEDSYLRNVSNLDVPTNGSVNGCWMANKLVVASNTQFLAMPGRSLDAISMVRDVATAPECLGKLDEMRVYAYNGISTDNFQVYHSNTSVLPRPPGTCTPTTRTGISGLVCPIAALGAAVPTVTFSVSPGSVVSGQAALLNWNTSGATTVTINQGIGTVAAAGTRSVTPTATTTYTFTATNAAGTTTATATVTVTAPPVLPPTVSIGASPSSIPTGGSSTLSWTATNATSLSINQAIGTVAASGTRTVSPAATTTYTVTATNAAGSTTAVATVTVTAPLPGPPTVSFSASPTSIASGASSTLTWSTTGATSVSINQGIGTVAASGTRSVSPTGTTTYTLTATNAGGTTTATASVTVAVPQLAVSHPSLYFGSRGAGVLTPAQTEAVSIVNANGALIDWTVSSSATWLTVSAGGRGNGWFTVSVAPGSYAVGTQRAQVTVSAAGLSPAVIAVSFTSYASTGAPVGSFDTPADNALNITGSIPVTGWALHQAGVSRVDVYRDTIPGEGTPGGLVFIGTAEFVEGARPDVEAAFASPLNYRAGWGLMVLSNMLPNEGNGTFVLHAIATGLDGNTAVLGRRTITCANGGATLPDAVPGFLVPEFGAIGTPGQWDTVSGTIVNWGWAPAPWAPAPLPYAITADGTGLDVSVDGVLVGVRARVGFGADAPVFDVEAAEDGSRLVAAKELDRIAIALGGPGYDAAMLIGTRPGALPAGSRFDADSGELVWQAGVGFNGRYDFLFTRGDDRIPVSVVIGPKHAAGSLVESTIDVPVMGTTADGAVTIAGWAFDRGAARGSGVDAVHVWAYPVRGGAPLFLGTANHGERRPDVGAAFGAPFEASGFSMPAAVLPPGTYDIAVFSHSTVSGAFAPAKVVRVTIR